MSTMISENMYRRDLLLHALERVFGDKRFEDHVISQVYSDSRLAKGPDDVIVVLANKILELTE